MLVLNLIFYRRDAYLKNRVIISLPFLIAFAFIIFNLTAFINHSETIGTKIEINKRKMNIKWANIPYELLNNAFITSLSEDNNLIWIGTWSDGLIVYDSKSGKLSSMNFDSRNPIISSFAYSNECWFGLGDGTIGKAYFNDNTIEIYEFEKDRCHSWFESIINFNKKLWFASPEEIITYDPQNDVWSKINLPINTMEFQQWKNDFVMKTIRTSSGWALSTAEYQTGKKKSDNILMLKDLVQKRLVEGRSIEDIFSEQINLRGSNSIILRKNIRLNASDQKLAIVQQDKVIFLSKDGEIYNIVGCMLNI